MSVESLLSLPTTQLAATRWLQAAAALLQGYAPLALVVRRSPNAADEIRRWSETPYLALPGQLCLDPKGRLFRCEVGKQRWISPRVHDQIMELKPLPSLQPDDLEAVVQVLIAQHGLQFWRRWPELGQEQRLRLARVPQPWEVLQEALAHGPEVLTLLLSEQSHEQNRLQLLRAGAAGSYAPPPDCLPYLLLQVEWNMSPGILGLACACMQAHPQACWGWRTHPNPVVRRRLARMLPDGQDWFGWLGEESDKDTREALRLRVEKECQPEQLVAKLLSESCAQRRATLGWLLTHWSQPYSAHKDWKAVEKLLSEPQREAWKKRVRRT